jgi:hypothetical protein
MIVTGRIFTFEHKASRFKEVNSELSAHHAIRMGTETTKRITPVYHIDDTT